MTDSSPRRNGFARLQTFEDLRNKLRHDLERVRAEPFNSYAMFDFFVTADHLLDWAYPGRVNTERRSEMRRSEALLAIVNAISAGAKHFIAEAPHHDPGTRVSASGRFDHRSFDPARFSPQYFDFGRIKVKLSRSTGAKIGVGDSIDGVLLAEKVAAFWEAHSET